jgi:glutathione S-transferase
LPKDEPGRLDVTRWQFWDVAHWDPAFAILFFENIVKPVVLKSGEPDAAAIAKGEELFHRAAKVLDDHLKGKKFVTRDKLTVADFSLGAPLNYAEIGRIPIEPYGEIKPWHATLAALPSWRKTQEQSSLRANETNSGSR